MVSISPGPIKHCRHVAKSLCIRRFAHNQHVTTHAEPKFVQQQLDVKAS